MVYRFGCSFSPEGDWIIARCIELGITTQGKTLKEARDNLREAIELYIESFGLDDIPDTMGEPIFSTIEVIVNA